MNPKAPRVMVEAAHPEVVGDLEAFLARLAAFGADDDTLADVAARWDVFDADWTPAKRAELVRTPDVVLRRELRRVDGEFDAATSGTPVADEQAADAAYWAARAEAVARIGQSVPALVAWVADDPVRARAVVAAEHDAASNSGRPVRATLVGPLGGP